MEMKALECKTCGTYEDRMAEADHCLTCGYCDEHCVC